MGRKKRSSKEIEENTLILLKKYRDEKDLKVFNAILELNNPLCYHVAKKYENEYNSLDDLASIGRNGLIKAIKSFDVDKAVKFATYATRCITNEIFMYFRKDKKHHKNMSMDEVIFTSKDGSDIKLEDMIADENNPNPLDTYIEGETKERVLKALERLDTKERQAIRLTYLEGKNQREACDIMLISQSYLSRLTRRGLMNMRTIMEREEFGMPVMSEETKRNLVQAFESELTITKAGIKAGVSYDTARRYHKKFKDGELDRYRTEESIEKQKKEEVDKIIQEERKKQEKEKAEKEKAERVEEEKAVIKDEYTDSYVNTEEAQEENILNEFKDQKDTKVPDFLTNSGLDGMNFNFEGSSKEELASAMDRVLSLLGSNNEYNLVLSVSKVK